MRLLVTGGAGYIGSVVAAVAAAEGHQVAILDDLSTGHADAVPAAAAFTEGTVRDHARALLRRWGVVEARIGVGLQHFPFPADAPFNAARTRPRAARPCGGARLGATPVLQHQLRDLVSQ